MWKHYVAGVVPGLVLNIRYGFSGNTTIFSLLFVGLLAGFIGHMEAQSKSKQPPKALRDVTTSFVLGTLFVIVGLPLLDVIWMLF